MFVMISAESNAIIIKVELLQRQTTVYAVRRPAFPRDLRVRTRCITHLIYERLERCMQVSIGWPDGYIPQPTSGSWMLNFIYGEHECSRTVYRWGVQLISAYLRSYTSRLSLVHQGASAEINNKSNNGMLRPSSWFAVTNRYRVGH